MRTMSALVHERFASGVDLDERPVFRSQVRVLGDDVGFGDFRR